MLLKFIENIKENGKCVNSFPETKIILILKKTHLKKSKLYTFHGTSVRLNTLGNLIV